MSAILTYFPWNFSLAPVPLLPEELELPLEDLDLELDPLLLLLLLELAVMTALAIKSTKSDLARKGVSIKGVKGRDGRPGVRSRRLLTYSSLCWVEK
jgi:hypothetical protein